MAYTNLYKEISHDLKKNGKSWKDVRFIKFASYDIDIVQFIEKAKKFDYDNGYGSEYVPVDYLIVGDDWWLERGTYDGAEWWDFKTLPTRSETRTDIDDGLIPLCLITEEDDEEDDSDIEYSDWGEF